MLFAGSFKERAGVVGLPEGNDYIVGLNPFASRPLKPEEMKTGRVFYVGLQERDLRSNGNS